MTARKGLGQPVEKSLLVMDELKDALRSFSNIPLKKGLASIDMEPNDQKELTKAINDTASEAFQLLNKIEDLQSQVRKARPKASTRFANRVVEGFLKEQS